MDDGNTNKKAKATNKCVAEKKLNIKITKVESNETISKSQQRLSSHYGKRLQTYDRITSYPYGSSVGKVCKTEILSKVNIK